MKINIEIKDNKTKGIQDHIDLKVIIECKNGQSEMSMFFRKPSTIGEVINALKESLEDFEKDETLIFN